MPKNNFIIYAFIITAGIFLQTQLALSADVSYLIYVTDLIWQGKKYGQGIFETNPPMILYLYTPILYIAKYGAISLSTACKIYVFSLLTISFGICHWLIKQLIPNTIVFNILSYAILIIFCILPVEQFGQREHLLLILALPYFFAAAIRLYQKDLPWHLACIIGLFAGLGFGIKPYFLCPLILIEAFFIFHTRQLLGWVRIESALILAILIYYLYSTLYFFPGYLTTVLPLVNQFYFMGVYNSWASLIFHGITLFNIGILACAIFYILKYPKDYLVLILTLGLFGLILTSFLGGTNWYYHLIPAYSFAILLLSIAIAHLLILAQHQPNDKINLIFYIIPIFCVLFNPVTHLISRYSQFASEFNTNKSSTIVDSLYLSTVGSTVYCFSPSTTAACFPMVQNTQAVYTSRYPFFWWIRGLVKLENANKLKKNEFNRMVESVVDDLTQSQTQWVIVDVKNFHRFLGKAFNPISYFSKNPKFSELWATHYHYKTTINNFDIYERI